MIWFLKLVVLLSGKNLERNALVSSSHVVIHLEGKEWSHALALSLNEKGNRRNRASVDTPLIFNVSHTSKKTDRCKLGSSNGVPPDWDCCTMEITICSSYQLFTSTLGRAMLETMPWTPRVKKSLSILIWSAAPPAMVGEVSRALHLGFSSLCFFLLKWKAS